MQNFEIGDAETLELQHLGSSRDAEELLENKP